MNLEISIGNMSEQEDAGRFRRIPSYHAPETKSVDDRLLCTYRRGFSASLPGSSQQDEETFFLQRRSLCFILPNGRTLSTTAALHMYFRDVAEPCSQIPNIERITTPQLFTHTQQESLVANPARIEKNPSFSFQDSLISTTLP